MRITNGIMMNNNLSNINKNKIALDNIMTQIETTKKIQRASEDPITAIRALRLRSTYNEITQYKDRNVEDAEAWMSVTKDAMDKSNEVLENIVYTCNQGVNTYNTVDEYESLIKSMKQYRDAVYQNGNADYGDRTIFTGYKTDETLTFVAVDNYDVSYSITQNCNYYDIESMGRVVGIKESDIDADGTNAATGGQYVGADVENLELNIMRLAYNKISADDTVTIAYKDVDATGNNVDKTITANVISLADTENPYEGLVAGEVRVIAETGEMIFGDDVHNELLKKDFSVTYTKNVFEEGDLKPEHYFDCVKTEKIGKDENGDPVYDTMTYTKKNQEISYMVSFNQEIVVNVQAQDVLSHNIGRDLDEIIERLDEMVVTLRKKEDIETKLAKATSETEKANYEAMLTAIEVEQSYVQENLKDSFASGIEKFKGHQQTVSVELSDLAARMDRLSLIKDRLSQQSLTVEELKSNNEDTNLTDAAVQYKTLNSVYEASLSTAAKVVQQSLLDFL